MGMFRRGKAGSSVSAGSRGADGQGLRLSHPADPTHAPDLATHAVEVLQAVVQHQLTYDLADLPVVDAFVGTLGKRAGGVDKAAELIFELGCFVGEVMVRRAGGDWEELDAATSQTFGATMGVRLPNGTLCNPIGKVFRRARGESDDSLADFYLDALA